ncbi:MAG: DUF1573 domain-containing protein [Bacteroidota bacterium]
MKKIAIFGLSAMLLVSLAAFKPKPKKVAAAKPVAAPAVVLTDKAYDVKFDKTFHDFGNLTEGQEVKTTYVITNIGKEPVVIMSHEVQCGCTTPTYSKEPIMPGKSADIIVGFNSAGKGGAQEKTVTLTTNGGKHELKFKCFVGEKAKVDPLPSGGVKLKQKSN